MWPADYAEPQRRSGLSGLSLLATAAQTLAIPSDERPLVVADYGSATGRNSAAPMRTVVDIIRQRAASLPMAVFHNDQPANDSLPCLVGSPGRAAISKASRAYSSMRQADPFTSSSFQMNMWISDGLRTRRIG